MKIYAIGLHLFTVFIVLIITYIIGEILWEKQFSRAIKNANQASLTYKIDLSTTAKDFDLLEEMKGKTCNDFDGALGEITWEIVVSIGIARGCKWGPKITRGPEFWFRSLQVNLGKLWALLFTTELRKNISSDKKLGPGLGLVWSLGTMIGTESEFEEFFKYCRHQILLFLSTGQ